MINFTVPHHICFYTDDDDVDDNYDKDDNAPNDVAAAAVNDDLMIIKMALVNSLFVANDITKKINRTLVNCQKSGVYGSVLVPS
jgi:hypothetical protein